MVYYQLLIWAYIFNGCFYYPNIPSSESGLSASITIVLTILAVKNRSDTKRPIKIFLLYVLLRVVKIVSIKNF